MKKFIYLFIVLLSFSCSDNTLTNNCFLGVTMNEVIDLTQPEFNSLLVPGGHSENFIAGRKVLIIRIGNSGYRAFDLQCPDGGCNSAMSFDGLLITCPCDNKEYNYLQGGAPQNGEGCSALQYNINAIGSSTLRISL